MFYRILYVFYTVTIPCYSYLNKRKCNIPAGCQAILKYKEDMVMLKKIALFLEEYYDECGRK